MLVVESKDEMQVRQLGVLVLSGQSWQAALLRR